MTSHAPTVGVSSTHPKDMPPDHADIPVWNAENWFYEDWPVGQKIRSLRREGELALYCEHLQTVKYKNPATFAGETET